MASENVTLDGVMEDPENWAFPYQTDDMFEFLGKGMDASDTLLFGRVTYEKFAAFWPTSEMEPFASKLNNSPKYVASTTLGAAPWGSHQAASVLNGDLAAEVNRLKRQDGKDISILGSGTLVRWLLQHNLLDELLLLVHPLVLGRGKRLFTGGTNANLTLVDSSAFSGGVVLLRYRPDSRRSDQKSITDGVVSRTPSAGLG